MGMGEELGLISTTVGEVDDSRKRKTSTLIRLSTTTEYYVYDDRARISASSGLDISSDLWSEAK